MKQRSVDAQLRGAKKKGRRNVKRAMDCGGKKRYRDHGGWHLTSQEPRR